MAPFSGRRAGKELDKIRNQRRIHHIVPWIKNPLQGVDKQSLVFAPRHEASTIELFFDLFFVANLATFTTYHSVSNHSELLAYVGFFAIIWSSWFHVTLHDVRFAHDTIYERICKTIQMIAFVGFALIGSDFNPGTKEGNNMNFRVLCYVLILTRVLMVIQYFVVAVFVGKSGRTDIYLPVLLNIGTYAVSSVAFAAVTAAFDPAEKATPRNGIYSVWWIVMLLESLFVIVISCVWRMLSFKKTHLVERMGLLTLIVIGEGAIGVTKTVTRLMGKTGLKSEYVGLVVCIVLILVALWMIYFDNHPHGHYGTIRQQLWSTLHFPLHLAIVGVVEGAQQLAAARYLWTNVDKLFKKLQDVCVYQNLDGQDLQDQLQDIVDYYQFDKKLETLYSLEWSTYYVYLIGNETGICSFDNVTALDNENDFPPDIATLFLEVSSGMYAGLGIKLPDTKQWPILVADESWRVVFRYFWACMTILFICYMATMYLIRRNKADAFDWVSMIVRGFAVAVSVAFLAMSANKTLLDKFSDTPVIIPVALLLFLIILVADRFSSWIANRRNRKSGEPLTGDHTAHDHGHDAHGHGEHGHGEHGHGEHGHGERGHSDHVRESKGSYSTATVPLVHSGSSYNPFGGGMMPSYMTSGPYSPPAQPYVQNTGQQQGFQYTPGYEYNAGGYQPVDTHAHRY